MFKPYPCYVGFRHFTSGSGSQLVSFISLLAIMGLVLGEALLILVMSIMNGFDHEMETRILGAVPHIRLFQDGGVTDVPALTQSLAAEPNVLNSMPFSQIDGMLTSKGKARPVQVFGIDEGRSDPFIGQFIPENLRLALNASSDEGNLVNQLLLGKAVADKLAVTQGDRVILLVPQMATSSHAQLAPQVVSFVVAGVFSTHTALDQQLAIAQLGVVSALINPSGYPQGMQVKLKDIFQARETGFTILKTLPQGYRFSDWIQTHGNLYQAIKMSRNMVSLLVFLIIAIAVFNVVSMLMMTVVDKRAAISILKTQGATNMDVVLIFLSQSLLIGLVGSILGVALGVLAALNASDVVKAVEVMFGINFLSSEVYPIDYLPSQLAWDDVFLVVVVALGLNFIATLYPASRAAKIQPAVVLRYE